MCSFYGNRLNCMCLIGWIGFYCNIDVDECCLLLCGNLGLCYNMLGGYNCICLVGFMGEYCDKYVDECFYDFC